MWSELSVPEQGSWLWGAKTGVRRATLLSRNPLCWWFERTPDVVLPMATYQSLGKEGSVSPHCFPETLGAHIPNVLLPTTEKRGKSWLHLGSGHFTDMSSERSKLLWSSLKYHLTAIYVEPVQWSQFIDVNWLVNTRCVLTGHIANHLVMAATSGGTGFAESLQHWIGHQSSAPSVYGRLTASIYERHWALSSKTVLQSFCNILYHPSSIQVCTSPSTVLLVSFSDCLNEIIMRLVIKLE